MKRLSTFTRKLEVQDQERKARKKAHWKSIGRPRQIAYHGTCAFVVSILAVGLLTKTAYTASFFALLVLGILPLILRSPGWGRLFVIQSALSPILTLPLLFAIGGMTLNINYDYALEQQTVLSESTEKIARDAEQFRDNYLAGKVKLSPNSVMDHRESLIQRLAANDRLGHKGAQQLFGLLHLTAPRGMDTSLILPAAEMLYADYSVILYDETISQRHSKELQDALEAQNGIPFEQIPADVRLSERPGYLGISILSCSFKENGELLLATGLPNATYTDMRKVAGGEAFVEVCQTVANNPDNLIETMDI